MISSLKRKEKEHAEEKKRKQELGVEDEFVTSDEMQRDYKFMIDEMEVEEAEEEEEPRAKSEVCTSQPTK